MSHRLSIIESATIKGAGLFSCWPYGGAYDGQTDDSVETMAAEAIALIDSNASEGWIDDTSNIADQAIYIYSGRKDKVTAPKGQDALWEVYENYETDKMTWDEEEDWGHDFPDGNMRLGLKTIFTDLGYITDWNPECSYNELEELGTWKEFSQAEFVSPNSVSDDGDAWTYKETEFSRRGGFYIPNACKDEQCHVHFAFHGCGSDPEFFASKHYGDLNILAATNDIIIVYPGSEDCWNDGGWFDTEHYLLKDGLYQETIMAMICRATHADAESAADCSWD